MGMAAFFEHLFLVMASCLGLVGVPLPLPVPPLPEDPALLSAAPADCLLYVQWFGADGAPDGESKNRCERLAAEPEVRAAMQQLVRACRGALAANLGEAQAKALQAMFGLAADALQRPGCAFVSDLEPFGGAIVLQAETAPALAKLLGKALDALSPEGGAAPTRDFGGVGFRVLPLGQDGEMAWAAIGDHLVLAVGDRAARQVAAGLRGEDDGLAGHADLRRLREGCRVERPMLRTFADLAALGGKLEVARRFWEPLGLLGVKRAFAESGLDGDGFVSHLQLVSPEPQGLLGRFGERALSQDDLGPIPEDATVALALRLRERGLEAAALDAVAALAGQRIDGEWRQFLAMAKQRTGFHFVDDLVVHADDCVVAWSAPSDGGLGFTSATAAVPLRDAAAFGENMAALWRKMEGIAPTKDGHRAQGTRLSYRAYLEKLVHDGNDVWWVDLVDRDAPFAFAWTNTDQHFLIGLQPQPVKSAIDRTQVPNFDHALARRPQVARRGRALAMLYLDLEGLLRQTYGALLLMFQSETLEWQREGFDFDLADLPQLRSLAPHLGPELVVLEAADGGFRLTRRGSLPVFDPLLVTAGIACSLR